MSVRVPESILTNNIKYILLDTTMNLSNKDKITPYKTAPNLDPMSSTVLFSKDGKTV